MRCWTRHSLHNYCILCQHVQLSRTFLHHSEMLLCTKVAYRAFHGFELHQCFVIRVALQNVIHDFWIRSETKRSWQGGSNVDSGDDPWFTIILHRATIEQVCNVILNEARQCSRSSFFMNPVGLAHKFEYCEKTQDRDWFWHVKHLRLYLKRSFFKMFGISCDNKYSYRYEW